MPLGSGSGGCVGGKVSSIAALYRRASHKTLRALLLPTYPKLWSNSRAREKKIHETRLPLIAGVLDLNLQSLVIVIMEESGHQTGQPEPCPLHTILSRYHDKMLGISIGQRFPLFDLLTQHSK